MTKSILVTGSEGYIGQQLVNQLSDKFNVVGVDIRPPKKTDHYQYSQMDIRDPSLKHLMKSQQISQVIHLASVVEPSGNRQQDFDIDVNGTRNVLDAAVHNSISHICITSSGAAYGYHADNPDWIQEGQAIRGNDVFSYSQHKRLIEEMLAQYRVAHPSLKQLVLRPGTVLGAHTDNLITRLFTRPRLLKIQGSDSPFVFIWDKDVINIIAQGVENQREGAFNLAGDGALAIQEIAAILRKPVLTLPAWLLKSLLRIGKWSGIGRYGPEQIDFLRYRPVLDNTKLKKEFSYTPDKTSREVFEFYARQRGLL